MFRNFLSFLLAFLIYSSPLFSNDIDELKKLDLAEIRKQGKTSFQNSPLLDEYLNQLIEESARKSLSINRHWLRLLRFKKSKWGRWASEVDNENYFISEVGNIDPFAELESTLRAFFYDGEIQNGLMHPQCAYPERYRWLKHELKFDSSKLIERHCTRFEEWKNALNPDSISVVFSSYYMQAPASMFGHTLFKLNNKLNENSELLDYGVNYAATPEPMNAIKYAVYGLIGGYPGRFAIFPYYLKVNEYNDLESRDLWEYKIKLTEEQKDRFIRHLWEMSRAEFDYFFINENCSYHLMEMMEVTNPELEISNKTGVAVSPPDSIKVYIDEGLISSQKYRPSLYSNIHYQVTEMTDSEKNLFWEMILFDPQAQRKQDASIRYSLVYDAVLNTYRYKYGNRDRVPKEAEKFYKNLLIDRSKLVNSYTLPEIPPRSTPPEQSHPLSRVAFSFGNSSIGNFMEFRYRFAYHDLLNVSKGHVPNSELAFFDTAVRRYDNNNIELTELSILKVKSLSPYNAISKDISYTFDIGVQTANIRKGDDYIRHPVGNVDLKFGYSFSNEFSKNPMSFGIFSILTGFKVQSANIFENGIRYGMNLNLMYQKEFGNWKILTGLVGQNFQISRNKNSYFATAIIRYAFNNANELRIEINGERYYEEILLSYHYLF